MAISPVEILSPQTPNSLTALLQGGTNTLTSAIQNAIQNAPKYFVEGLAVAVAAKYIPSRGVTMRELLMLALAAALTFWVLDTFAPHVAPGARLGAGFGLGANTVGFEGMCGGSSCGAGAEAEGY